MLVEEKLFMKDYQASVQSKYTISGNEIYPMPYVRLLAVFQEPSEDPEGYPG
ncbi:MAG: hypothetical protein ABI045_02535 [Flavobacteriales bacterium]